MPQIRLTLFGHPRLEIHNSIVEFKSRKGLALVAFLADGGTPENRDILATLLWPDHDQTRARANLRRTLFNLNKSVIGEWLSADQDTIHLALDRQIDVIQFRQKLAQGSTDRLEEAAELYQGDFLAGFYLADSSGFEEWASVARDGYRRQMLGALDTLTTHQLEQALFDTAESYARRQLGIDNLRESAWRQLMEALVRDGRRNEALNEYEKCRRLLWEELAVQPAAETVALYESIRHGEGTEPQRGQREWVRSPSVEEDLERQDKTFPQAVSIPSATPYRGLFAFGEEDAPFFFGREEFTELLVTAVQDGSIVAVIGSSGSGKSSVVHAGLAARLQQRQDWVIASFRPGQRPFYALAEALIPYLESGLSETEELVQIQKLVTAMTESEIELIDVVTRLLKNNSSNRLMLIADQFEELYTLCPDVELRHQFLDTLLELVFSQQYRPAPLFTLVLTLRADFLGQALAYRPTADALQESDVKLGPMTRAELARAVSNPAQLQGAGFESGLAARILDDVGDQPGNLPLLEFALTSLWEKQQESRLTHEAYEAIGRVDGALARYADEVYGRLTTDERETARRIFIQMVRPGEGTEDTRRLATRSELGESDWQLVPQLADARLLVTGSDPAGYETAEVVHEALLSSWGQLRGWMAEDRDFRLWQERLRVALHGWHDSGLDESSLLRGVALVTAESWMAERPFDLSRAEGDYIKAGLDLRGRRQTEQENVQRERDQLRRRITQALSAGLVITLLLTILAGLQWNTARQNASRAELQADVALSRQLVLQVADQLDQGRVDVALLLAIEAARTTETPETWSTLRRAIEHPRPLQRTFTGHREGTESAIWSADGSRLLTASNDHTARVWDAETGELLLTLSGHSDALFGAIWNADESRILTNSNDGTARVWDAKTGEDLLLLSGHVGESANQAWWSPDESRIVTAGGDAIAKVWDAETGEELLALEGHTQFIQQVRWNGDGSRIITNSADRTARIWDASTGAELLVLSGHDDGVFQAEWNAAEDRILTASIDGNAKLWDAKTGQELMTFSGHSGFIWQANWNKDETQVLTASHDGTARLWDSLSGRQILVLSGHESEVIHASWNEDESMILTGSWDGSAAVWDAHTGTQIVAFGHGTAVLSASWGSGGQHILTSSADGAVRVFALNASPKQFELPPMLGSPIEYFWAELNEAEDLILTASADPRGYVRVWDLETGSARMTLAGHTGSVQFAMWNGDESLILTASDDKTARLFDAVTGDQRLALSGHSETVVRASWNGDESRILTASADGTAGAWDASTGELLFSLRHEQRVNEARWSADGRQILTASDDGTARVWDAESGEALFTLAEHTDEVWQAAWSDDESRILTSGKDGSARIWDAMSGELRHILAAHSDTVSTAQWNQNGSRILTSSHDGTARVWDANSGEHLLVISDHLDEPVWGAMWGPDEKRIITQGGNGTIRTWDAETGKELQIIAENRGTRGAGWNSDESRIFVLGDAGVRQYYAQMEDLIDAGCRRLARNLTPDEWLQFLGESPYRDTCPDTLSSPESS